MTQAISSTAPAAILAGTSHDAGYGSATNAFDGHDGGFGAACAAATTQSNQPAPAAAGGAKMKPADTKAGESGTVRKAMLSGEGATGSRSSSSVDRILQRMASGDGSALPPRTAKTAAAPAAPGHALLTDPIAAGVTAHQRAEAEAIDSTGEPAGDTTAQGIAKIRISLVGQGAGASAHKAAVPEVGEAVPLPKTRARKDTAKTGTTPQPFAAALALPQQHYLTNPHHKADDAGGIASASLAATSGHGARLPVFARALGAAAAHPSPAKPRPDAQPQLLRSTADLASAGGGSAKITLHPESLGTVVVKVVVNAQGVTSVHMTASTEGGLQALAAGAGQLAQHLAQSGLTVGAVQTSLTNTAPPPQPATAAQSQGSHLGGGGGGFAGTSQHSGSGQKQPQPQDTGQTPADRPRRGGPDSTVKAYA